jgi:hypothetical protein
MQFYEFHERRQIQMQNRILWIFASLSLVYAFFLFPDRALELALSTSDPLGKAIARLVGLASCMGSLRFVMFASDPLFTGRGRAARFVRSTFPSIAAEEKLGCTREQADELWFKYFDSWGNPASPNHMLMRVTYERTYQARLVHSLERFLLWIFAVSLATMLLNGLVFDAFAGPTGRSRFFLQAVVAACFCAAWIVLVASNRLDAIDRPPTGVWRQLRETCDRARVQFRREVLDHANDVDSAFARIEELRAPARPSPPSSPRHVPRPSSRPSGQVPETV